MLSVKCSKGWMPKAASQSQSSNCVHPLLRLLPQYLTFRDSITLDLAF